MKFLVLIFSLLTVMAYAQDSEVFPGDPNMPIPTGHTEATAAVVAHEASLSASGVPTNPVCLNCITKENLGETVEGESFDIDGTTGQVTPNKSNR